MQIRAVPNTNISLPKGYESSYLRSPLDSDSPQKVWQKNNRNLIQERSNSQAIDQLTRELGKIRRRILGGAPMDLSSWHKPKNRKYEVDPTYAYNEGSVIHIQPTNDLVTTGIRDAANPSGGLVTSCAGFWVAIQDVPAKTTVSGNDVWNLPQYPLPNPANLDDSSNYWIYLGEAITC